VDKALTDLATNKAYLLGKKHDIGGGTPPIGNKTMTKEQFDKLGYKERVELSIKNNELYKQLMKG
jgi:hypothetical protein